MKLFDVRSQKIELEQKRHRLPVTCLGFKADAAGHPEYILSGSPDYTYNIISCKVSVIGKFISDLNSLGSLISWLMKLILIAAVIYILLGLI